MTNAILCILLSLAACGYAFVRGGAPERWAAAILLMAMLATTVVIGAWPTRYRSVETGVLASDLLALAALALLAVRANRFWTIGVAALQLAVVAAHLVMLAGVTLSPGFYARMIAYPIYPQLLLIAAGTWHHRQRLRRTGVDRSWTISSSRSARARAT